MTIIAIIAVIVFFILKPPLVHRRASSLSSKEGNRLTHAISDSLENPTEEKESRTSIAGQPVSMTRIIISVLKLTVSRRMWLLMP
jgi:hypothetical protein